MDGPTHFAEAERLLMLGTDSGDYGRTEKEYLAIRKVEVARAQVHATLALTAATAFPTGQRTTEHAEEWRQAVFGRTTPQDAPPVLPYAHKVVTGDAS